MTAAGPRLVPTVTPAWRRPLVAVGALAAVAATATDDGPVLCPFRRCTGGYCPGCGATRAAGSLLRGDLAGSWRQHPFVAIAAVQAAVVAAWWASSTPESRTTLRRRVETPLLVANAVLLVAIWALRLSTGQIPVPFANWF